MQNFLQKITCTLAIRRSKAKLQSVPYGNIVIQVVIDGEADRIPLSINWPLDKFNKKTGQLLPRFKDDEEEAHRQNLLCQNELGKASKLALQYYTAEKIVAHKEFKQSLNRFASREDVLIYMQEKGPYLVREGLVSGATGKKYVTCLNRLEKYFESADRWRFNTVKLENILKFDSWIRRQPEWGHNTACATMRVLHKFFKCATADGIPFNDPMDSYAMPEFADGIRDIPTPTEYKTLLNAYKNGNLTEHEKDVVLRYLLSCNSGLRKSDIEQLDTRLHIKGNVLRLTMHKTARFGKAVEYQPPAYFFELIGKRKGKLFAPMESALLNKTLRKVFERNGGETYLKFHSGRDFFASRVIESNGNIKDLQDILGHGNIKYTMIYVKMGRRTKDAVMKTFNQINN